MVLSKERREQLATEFIFSASRSSGPGGQNVNKVNTRVELRFNVWASGFLSADEKQRITTRLKKRMNSAGELILVSQAERSQWKNREKVTALFFKIFEGALTPVKKRVRTSPTAASKVKRLELKKLKAQKKQLRRPPGL